MKKQLLLLILSLIFTLKGCQYPPSDSEDTTTPPSPPVCAADAHIDEGNDGYCDTCNEYVIVTLDFYALNDLHGKLADGTNHIGLDEMSTYLKNARANDEYSLLFSAGDMWQGSPESNNTNGNIVTDWMSEMDFDAMVLGNHEYDWGEDAIRQNQSLAEFPFLAINIYERTDNTLVDYCQPSLLIDKGKIQIGVIGAMGDCYSSISGDKTEDIYFITGSSLTSLVKAESERLREAGADFIVYLIHDGYEQTHYGSALSVSNNALSAYYDTSLSDGYVDLVFEGHTHQRYILRDGYGVHHLQAGGDNKGLSHAEIEINIANGYQHLNTAEYVEANQYASLEKDSIVDELLQKYDAQISNALRNVGYNARYRNSTFLRNLVAKLYYEVGVETWAERYDITLGGGFISVRSPYEISAGDVSYGTLQSIFPFDNDLVLCSVKGRDLLSRFINTTNNNYYIYLGGKDKSTVAASIDPNATYYIVTDTYCSSYAPNKLTVVEKYTSGIYARDLLADYITAGGLAS